MNAQNCFWEFGQWDFGWKTIAYSTTQKGAVAEVDMDSRWNNKMDWQWVSTLRRNISKTWYQEPRKALIWCIDENYCNRRKIAWLRTMNHGIIAVIFLQMVKHCYVTTTASTQILVDEESNWSQTFARTNATYEGCSLRNNKRKKRKENCEPNMKK